jgi:hypothetical protein
MHLMTKCAAWALVVASVSSIGCATPGSSDSESISTTSQAMEVTRAHHEEIDPQDGLFYSYWEKDYGQGDAHMDLKPFGYTGNVDYRGITTVFPNFVVGKGRKPCWGEQVNWQVNGTPSVSELGLYGWYRSPLVEYYIGRWDGSGSVVGDYHTSRGSYRLHVTPLSKANILNPDNVDGLPRNFLQFNCESLDNAAAAVGPVDLSEHFAAWEPLMNSWWPTQIDSINKGFSWFPPSQADYCLVGTEIYSPTTGNSDISNISFEERTRVDPIAQSVSAAGTGSTSLTYRVISSVPWTLTGKPDWVTSISPVVGDIGLTLVSVKVSANATANERRANFQFHVGGADIPVIAQVVQFYDGEGYTPTGGGGALQYQISPTGPWSAQSSAPEWLSVTPNQGSAGTYTLNTSATANTGLSARTGTVTITGGGADKTLKFTQEPVSLLADPMLVNVAAAGATPSVNIYSNVNWWSAYTTNGGGWLNINPGSYSGVGNGTVSFTVAPNTTGHDRTATITLAGGNVPTRAVTVIQAAGACDASNRLLNPGFESGTSGWTTWAGSLSAVGSPVRTGAASGRVTNRTAAWQGPVQDLIGKVTAGRTYTARAWAKVSGSSSQPLGLSLKTECVGSAPTYTSISTATGNSSSWTQLSGQFTAPSCSLASLALYVEGPSAGTTLYVDDAAVAQTCP